MSIIFDEQDIKLGGEIVIGNRWWTITSIAGDNVWLENQQNPAVTLCTPMSEVKRVIERDRARLTAYPPKRLQTRVVGG